MKKIIRILAVAMLSHAATVFSQTVDINAPGVTIGQVVYAMDTSISPADTTEGGPRDRLKYFNSFWGPRLSPNDSSGVNMFEKYYSALNSAIAAKLSSPCSSSGFTGNWKCFGPNNIRDEEDLGKVNSIWVDPADSDYILAGVSGGLFRTQTGGYEWECITDNTVLTGGVIEVSSIAVNPLNKQQIFLATSGDELDLIDTRALTNSEQYGAGILESSDGGNNWHQEFITSNPIESDQAVFLTPDTQRIYVFQKNQIWTRSNNSAGVWTNITPPTTPADMWWTDLQFDPADQNHFFVTGRDTSVKIYESSVGVPTVTGSWSVASTGLTSVFGSTSFTDANYGAITICLPNSDTLYAVAMGAGGLAALHTCNLSGTRVWTQRSGNMINATYPNARFIHLVVSPTNTENIYYASDVSSQSIDGGANFTEMAGYYSNECHADIRAMYLQHSTSSANGVGDRLYLATDGGVSKKSTGHSVTVTTSPVMQDISGKGLACGQFWSIGLDHTGALMVGGTQHTGFLSFESNLEDQWKHNITGDYSAVTFDNTTLKGLAIVGTVNVYSTAPATIAGITRKLGGTTSAGGFADVGGDFRSFMFIDDSGRTTIGMRDLWQRDLAGVWHNKSSDFNFITFTDDYIQGMEFNPHESALNGYVISNHKGNDVQKFRYINYPTTNFLTKVIPTIGDIATCVTMSPDEPQKVWLGMNGNGKCQVAYSSNYGNTQSDWYDVSYGLPANMPVTKLIYQENSGDVVYCATDIGVYRCDFSTFNPSAAHNGVEWKCFNSRDEAGKYFPNVFITDMKINYCQGKLYAATYGRGIWVSDLYPESEGPPDVNTISSSATVDGEHWMQRNIRVPSGVTLTISGATIHMPRNGKITVEQGGRLQVVNSTLTNDCDNCMWQGIEAWGNTEGQSSLSAQGWVRITNSTVEHAKIGVCNFAGGDPSTSGGGIIQAVNSKFLNNANAANFGPYHNYNASGLIAPNLSYFKNCTFSIDDQFKGFLVDAPFTSHVKLTGVEGIYLTGCSFINRKTTFLGQGYGVEALNAGFTVNPSCDSWFTAWGGCYHPEPSYFRGLMNGVLVQGITGFNQTVLIDQANFDSTGIGINVQAYNNVTATRNTFVVGRGYRVPNIPPAGLDIGCGWNIGILINNANTFTFESNSFTGRANINGIWPWYNIGTMIVNTGSADNKVYRSTFDSLTIGVLGAGNNHFSKMPGPAVGYGLQVLCNNFYDNYNDIVSTGNYSYEGIGQKQGTITAPAGNTFNGTIGNKNILNTNPWSDIQYYFYAGSGPELPSVPSLHVSLTPGSGGNSCVSTLGGSPIPFSAPATLGRITAILSSGNTHTLDSMTSVYTAAMDAGQTATLLNYVDTVTNNDSLFATLMPLSPYISDTVLKSTIIANILSLDQLDSLLTHNPEAVQHYSLNAYAASYFTQQQNQQTPDYAAGLAAIAATTSSRSALEAAMMGAKSSIDDENRMLLTTMQWAMDTAVDPNDTTGAGICLDTNSVYYMLDSNSCYWALDSVDAFLNTIADPWGQYARIGYWNAKAQYNTANAVFTGINSQTLLPAELTEYLAFDSLWTVLYSAAGSGRNVYSLSSNDFTALDTGRVLSLPAPAARSAINTLTKMKIIYQLCAYYEPLVKKDGRAGGNTSPAVKNHAGNNQFIVYPNPSNGLVTFDYNVQRYSQYGGIRITVTDIVGKKVMETNTNENSGLVFWDPKTLPPGVYLYRAINGKGVIATGKLVLTK